MSSAEIVGDICFTGAFADTMLGGHNASCNGYKRRETVASCDALSLFYFVRMTLVLLLVGGLGVAGVETLDYLVGDVECGVEEYAGVLVEDGVVTLGGVILLDELFD